MRFKSHELSLDVASRRARLADTVLGLEPKAFDLLEYLMKNPHRVVSKQELLDSLWWGEIVGESVLARSMSCLRKLLADDARSPRFIRTVHRCGYEFIAQIMVADSTASSAEAGQVPRSSGAFIGRTGELAVLRRALTLAAGQGQRAWLVRGEPGIGKTRLLEEVLRSAAGAFETHRAHGSRREGAPLSVLRRCLRSLVRSRTLKVVARAFRGASSETRRFLLDPEPRSELAWSEATASDELNALLAGLSELARARPLALVIDDLEVADAASCRLLELLLARRDAPVLLLGALRDPPACNQPEPAPLASLRAACTNELALSPLSGQEVAAFIRPWMDDVALAERLRQRTGGNPRLLSLLAEGGAEELAALRLPASIRAAARERLGVLPRETLGLLELASIPVPELTVRLLACALGQAPEQCERLLEPAFAARLLDRHEHQRVSFAHGIVRELLYDELEPDQRCSAHLAMWSALAETMGETNPRLRSLLRASVRYASAARACLFEAERAVDAREIPALLWSPTSRLGALIAAAGSVQQASRSA
jgi:DNA-binding winged helix-turn-helix (wHTH) protein